MSELESRLRAGLSERYRLERELGRGGMSTVFLAEDLRHGRPVAVKVLHPDIAGWLGADRFLQEIRITAQLDHPHILPLLDSGEAGDLLYYTMPSVEGESLRDRLQRERQLPIGDAVRMTREIADALHYAHTRGVIHRDIKPENILLSGGHARVADFGIARAVLQAGGDALTRTGLAVGTPGYMSPEQAAGDLGVDARSDVYALGCVLYEMLAGLPPYSGPTPQAVLANQLSQPVPDVAALRETVPPALREAVWRALARAPADRFATAAEFAETLARAGDAPVTTPPPFPSAPRRRRHVAALGGAVVVAVAAIAVLVHDAVPSVPFDERDWVVLADFDNRTGDSLFDASLNEAFRVAIQQSARVNIFPAPRVVETLRRMRQDTAASLTGGLAREVAQREALRLAVVPAISRLGDTYVLTTRVVDPATGEDLVARSERADRPEAVLVALDHLAIQLRRDLGESRLAVRRAGRPLPEVTTSSLDALRAWSLGRQVQFTSSEAFVHLQRAVELDSAFAMAHADLGAAYYWDGDRERGDHHFETALRLAERLTHRERLRLRATVLEWRRRDAEAVAAYEGMLLEYPDDRSVLFRLGYMHLRRNEWEAASEVFARLVAADSTDPSSRVNLASALAALGRYAQAVPEYRVAFALDSTMLMVPNLNLEFGASYVALGHYDSAEVLYRRLAAGDAVQRPQALRALGMLASHRGRFGDAAEMLRAAAVLQQESGASVSEARTRLQLAGAYRGMGDEVAAGRTLDRALALARGGLDPVWLERVGKLLARAGRVGDARALLTQLRDGMDSLNAVDRLEARILGAEVALAEGRTDDAVAEYERLRVTGGIAPVYLAEGHGRALHRAGRLAEAARAYESMLADSRLGFGWEPQLYAPAALLDLGLVYEAQADTARAGATYRRLLTLWRGGDPEAPLRDSVTARLDWLALAGGR